MEETMAKTYQMVRKCKAAVTETYDIPGATSPEDARRRYDNGERQLDETEIEDIFDETDCWLEETDTETGQTNEIPE